MRKFEKLNTSEFIKDVEKYNSHLKEIKQSILYKLPRIIKDVNEDIGRATGHRFTKLEMLAFDMEVSNGFVNSFLKENYPKGWFVASDRLGMYPIYPGDETTISTRERSETVNYVEDGANGEGWGNEWDVDYDYRSIDMEKVEPGDWICFHDHRDDDPNDYLYDDEKWEDDYIDSVTKGDKVIFRRLEDGKWKMNGVFSREF